jgi:hypothetical protein
MIKVITMIAYLIMPSFAWHWQDILPWLDIVKHT